MTICRIIIHAFACIIALKLAFCEARLFYIISQEGEKAKLYFSYSCNALRVTLQYQDQDPFYSSASPKYMSLTPKQKLEIRNGTDVCAIQLMFDPLSRDDDGTYILTAYKNDILIPPDLQLISLHVVFPPGKAFCELGDYHLDREWVSLQCTALLGSQPGQIDCYQNGVRLPNRNELIETYVNLKQIILARQDSVVYCCSSVIGTIKDECECKDWGWDPIINVVIDVPDPCPEEKSTLYTVVNITTNSTTNNAIMLATAEYPHNIKKCGVGWKITAILAMIAAVISVTFSIIIYFYKRRARSELERRLLVEKVDRILFRFDPHMPINKTKFKLSNSL